MESTNTNNDFWDAELDAYVAANPILGIDDLLDTRGLLLETPAVDSRARTHPSDNSQSKTSTPPSDQSRQSSLSTSSGHNESKKSSLSTYCLFPSAKDEFSDSTVPVEQPADSSSSIASEAATPVSPPLQCLNIEEDEADFAFLSEALVDPGSFNWLEYSGSDLHTDPMGSSRSFPYPDNQTLVDNDVALAVQQTCADTFTEQHGFNESGNSSGVVDHYIATRPESSHLLAQQPAQANESVHLTNDKAPQKLRSNGVNSPPTCSPWNLYAPTNTTNPQQGLFQMQDIQNPGVLVQHSLGQGNLSICCNDESQTEVLQPCAHLSSNPTAACAHGGPLFPASSREMEHPDTQQLFVVSTPLPMAGETAPRMPQGHENPLPYTSCPPADGLKCDSPNMVNNFHLLQEYIYQQDGVAPSQQPSNSVPTANGTQASINNVQNTDTNKIPTNGQCPRAQSHQPNHSSASNSGNAHAPSQQAAPQMTSATSSCQQKAVRQNRRSGIRLSSQANALEATASRVSSEGGIQKPKSNRPGMITGYRQLFDLHKKLCPKWEKRLSEQQCKDECPLRMAEGNEDKREAFESWKAKHERWISFRTPQGGWVDDTPAHGVVYSKDQAAKFREIFSFMVKDKVPRKKAD